MTFDITPILEAIIGLAATVVTCLLIPYIRSKTTAQEQKEINNWVRIAVAAAEQIYAGAGHGDEKYQYVLSVLREHGLDVDESRVKALIESTVYELTHNLFEPAFALEAVTEPPDTVNVPLVLKD